MANEVKGVVVEKFHELYGHETCLILDEDGHCPPHLVEIADCTECRFHIDSATKEGDALILFDDNTVKLEKAVRS